MASSKEIQISSRPLTQQRPSMPSGSPSSFATARQSSHSRNNSHSHSVLSGALNAHRVSRRKSMTNTGGANVAAAVAAALQGDGVDKVTSLPMAVGSRRGTLSKPSAGRSALAASLPSPPASLPTHKFTTKGKQEAHDSAIDDSNEMSSEETSPDFDQARVRRASDGQPLTKDGKKSNRVEVRCETCGKVYKHSSCLTKHLWEHTPEWNYTSKLLISKHQQVQLLEAASVLVGMNHETEDDVATPPDSAKDFASEPESAASPAASGYSDGRSSADTTPPPQADGYLSHGTPAYLGASKRYSSGRNGFSRSYQSAASGSFFPGSIPTGTPFGHHRQGSTDRRPPSSGRNDTNQEDRDLAAAVELLSCSFGSNGGSRDTRLPIDAPPVPPLPAQYLDQAAFSSTGFLNSYSSRQMPESFTRGEFRHSENVKMEESEDSVMDDDDDHERRMRAGGSEDDDMMFGHMED